MNTVTVLKVLDSVLTYGPSVIGVVQKLVADVEAGRGNQPVTAADLAELNRLAVQSAADIYARLGIALPPAAKS
jgi:hypothetical protein